MMGDVMGLMDVIRRAHIALTVPDEPEVAASSPSPSVAAANLKTATVAPGLQGLFSRDVAMSIPTVSRARDLHCTLAGSLPFQLWKRSTTPGEPDTQLPPATWMERPDPDRTRPHIIAWTVDDLLFWGRAFWRITSRLATGFPAAFKRLPYTEVAIGKDGWATWKGERIPPSDIVDFQGTGDGVLACGARAISTALQLEQAAERFAMVDTPAGWLKVADDYDGEPLSADDLREIATEWHAARMARTTGVVPQGLTFHESTSNPERLQLVAARQHSALELARLMDVPPWTVGAPTNNSLTYTNGQQSRADLIDFGTRQYLDVIEATLSGPNVTPRGTYVRFDLDAWLANPFNVGAPSGADQNRSEDAA